MSGGKTHLVPDGIRFGVLLLAVFAARGAAHASDRALGDMDADGDVDLADYALVQACYGVIESPPGDGCPVARLALLDVDGNGSLDEGEFEQFASCMSGPDQLPPPECLQPPLAVSIVGASSAEDGHSVDLVASVTGAVGNVFYEWQVLTGSAVFDDPAVVDPALWMTANQEVLVEITVRDVASNGITIDTAVDQHAITAVPHPQYTFEVFAGGDRVLTAGSTSTIDLFGAYFDPAACPQPAIYWEWDTVSIPLPEGGWFDKPHRLGTPSEPVRFTPLGSWVPGDYVFSLFAHNSCSGLEDEDTVVITIVECLNNSECDDFAFCNGVETCGAGRTCQAGANPCPGQLCNESYDLCVDCLTNADCDDGQFCNGPEACDFFAGICVAGQNPCFGQTCNEAGDTCTINQAPNADAGADQLVTAGQNVTLDGSGSSDPDGEALSFSWAQTAGTAVTLIGADTASPTITTPSTPGPLTFELTVDDGNGGTDSDSVVITVTLTVEPRLFIANFTGDGVLGYANPSTVNGNIAPDTNLDGAATLLDDPADIVVNSAGQLLAANFTANSITTYDDAENANGNLAPDGNVTGGATQLVDPVTLAINTAEDLLFVADLNGAGASRILVFSGTTGATFNGNLAPTRTITSADLADPLGINFGANDELYVANNSGGADNVLVFANASNLNGAVGATRILTSAQFGTLFDVFVDPNDNLFVVDSVDGEIYIFNDASSLNGPVTPDFTLDVTPAVTLTAIAVDSNDIGYIVDFAAGGTGAIFSYDNISTRNGSFNPSRTIQGAATQLAGPIRVFLTDLPEPPCTTNPDCDDDLFCNGAETCTIGTNGDGTCVPGTPPCDPGEICNEANNICEPTSGPFNFTQDQDNLVGTSGDDIFSAPVEVTQLGVQVNTLQNGDMANGLAGTDTLNASLINDGATDVILAPTLTGIEIFNLTDFGPDSFAGPNPSFGTALSGANITGLQTINSGSSLVNLTVMNMNTLTDLGVTNSDADLLVTYVSPAGNGNTDNKTLTLNEARDSDQDTDGGGADTDTAGCTVNIATPANGLETLNIASVGTTENTLEGLVQNGGTTLLTLNVTGSARLTIRRSAPLPATLTTVNAGTMTGATDLTLQGALNVTYTGGPANDVINFAGTYTTGDTINGGGGTNTLGINSAQAVSAVTNQSNVTNIQTILIPDSLNGAIDVTRFGAAPASAARDAILDTTAAATALTAGNSQVTLGPSGNRAITLNNDDTAHDLTVVVSGAGTTDVLTVNLQNADLGAGLTITGAEPVNLVSGNGSDGTAADGGANTATIVTVTPTIGAGVLNVQGPVSFHANGPITAGTINAGAAGAAFIMGATTIAGAGASIAGSAFHDLLIGSANADAIFAGDGNDTVRGEGGGDPITLGGGADTLRINALGANGLDRKAVTDFDDTAGTGDLFSLDQNIGGVNASLLSGTDNFTTAVAIQNHGVAGPLTVAGATEVVRVNSATVANFSDANSLNGTNLLTAIGGAITVQANGNQHLFVMADASGNEGVYYGDAGADNVIVFGELTLISVLQGSNVALADLVFNNFTNN